MFFGTEATIGRTEECGPCLKCGAPPQKSVEFRARSWLSRREESVRAAFAAAPRGRRLHAA
eukprot:3600744-Pleurochrysis_carterae.AAC.2